jgi:hypothetical protein
LFVTCHVRYTPTVTLTHSVMTTHPQLTLWRLS